MFKTIKNQKGITLVELLAVMVIVGIIAAISIPAIGNLIENTRKDAFIATATNVTEAARLVVAQNNAICAAESDTTCEIGFSVGEDEDEDVDVDGTSFIENFDGTAVVSYNNSDQSYEIAISDDRYQFEGDAFTATRDLLEPAPAPGA